MSDAWQDRIPEQLIEALLESDKFLTFTDEWRVLTGNEQLDHARSWLREALGLEASRAKRGSRFYAPATVEQIRVKPDA